MLTNARQKTIHSIALRDGEVIISRVAAELGVSIETIRRDINVMCQQNLLVKVHGGAVPAHGPISEASYRQRKKSNSATKNKLGAAAAAHIPAGAVIALSSGSTMEAVAARIRGAQNVTVLTNSLPVGEILSDLIEKDDFSGKTVLFGGELHPSEHFTHGAAVIDAIRRYHADVVFVSAAGISENGLMSTDPEEGIIAGELSAIGSKVILVAESGKLGKQSVYRFADFENISTLITDSETPIPPELATLFAEKNIEVQIVK